MQDITVRLLQTTPESKKKKALNSLYFLALVT